MQYTIGSFTQTLQFMGDGSVRVACDGSVSVACDGSVVPVPVRGAEAAVAADGSVRLVTPLVMLGDGSVRVGDGSVVPANDDGLLLPAVTFSPFPMISPSLTAIDNFEPSTFLSVFTAYMSLSGNDYTYSLSGGGTLTDALGNGVSLTKEPLLGGNAVFLGLVDDALVTGTGDSASFPPPASGGVPPFTYPYSAPSVSGAGSCAACTLIGLAMAFTGSGGGDTISLSATFDVDPVSVPAPAPLGLLAAGLVGLALVRRR
jgi:hypothetical protein